MCAYTVRVLCNLFGIYMRACTATASSERAGGEVKGIMSAKKSRRWKIVEKDYIIIVNPIEQ